MFLKVFPSSEIYFTREYAENSLIHPRMQRNIFHPCENKLSISLCQAGTVFYISSRTWTWALWTRTWSLGPRVPVLPQHDCDCVCWWPSDHGRSSVHVHVCSSRPPPAAPARQGSHCRCSSPVLAPPPRAAPAWWRTWPWSRYLHSSRNFSDSANFGKVWETLRSGRPRRPPTTTSSSSSSSDLCGPTERTPGQPVWRTGKCQTNTVTSKSHWQSGKMSSSLRNLFLSIVEVTQSVTLSISILVNILRCQNTNSSKKKINL